jgi:hypothetical protein
MAYSLDSDVEFSFAGTEMAREREDNRSLAKLVALWSLGAILALSVALFAGYRVIVSDPATAKYADAIAPALQAWLPFATTGDEGTPPAAVASDVSDEALGDIAPAAGPAARAAE